MRIASRHSVQSIPSAWALASSKEIFMEELSVKKKYYETVSNTIIKNLEKRQIEGSYCPDREAALKKATE